MRSSNGPRGAGPGTPAPEAGVFYAAAWRSLVLATLTTILSLIIGTMAAYALVRHRLIAKDLIKGFLLSPIVLPTRSSRSRATSESMWVRRSRMMVSLAASTCAASIDTWRSSTSQVTI